MITGLANQRELNGAVGHVVSYDATKERYGVEIRCQSKQRVALKRTNLYPVKSGTDGHGCQKEVVIEQDAYERRRKAALASSLECPICLEGMQDDHGGRALACGHRVHRSCWDELLAAQQKVTNANEDPIARCPVCRAWQGGDHSDQPWYDSWFKMTSTLSDDTAPSASLDHLEAQAAPTHPRAPPEQLGGSPWPQHPASGRPKVEESPLATTRCARRCARARGPSTGRSSPTS